MLAYKIEVNLGDSSSKLVKISDIRRIVNTMASLDSIDTLKA